MRTENMHPTFKYKVQALRGWIRKNTIFSLFGIFDLFLFVCLPFRKINRAAQKNDSVFGIGDLVHFPLLISLASSFSVTFSSSPNLQAVFRTYSRTEMVVMLSFTFLPCWVTRLWPGWFYANGLYFGIQIKVRARHDHYNHLNWPIFFHSSKSSSWYIAQK